MIAPNMREYDYFLYTGIDEYGQSALDETVKGKVKMSINLTSQAIQDNILYKDCSYLGLTFDKSIDDTYVIKYGNDKLKVKYINPTGRYNQVFMEYMNG